MSRKRTCSNCGAEVPSGELDRLCPSCVAQLAFLQGPEGALPAPPFISDQSGGGLRLFGDYELIEEIARGGMGVVYKARQLSLNRVVAIKMILTGRLASPADVQRFRAEAEAAANLQHPNIVATHEVGQYDGQFYFSMDYVAGRSLEQMSPEHGVWDAEWFRRVASYVKAIAEAIHYAHEQGTLHRDLKPSNILIDPFDQPRITDFGLAKRYKCDSDLTVTGQIIGTPNFMPPEQAVGRRAAVGPHSDVYSLGAILYFLVAGRPPFQGDTTHETLTRVLNSEPGPPHDLQPSVPRDLEIVCLKCLEKEPRRRYGAALDLAEDLGRFLHDEPVRARPVTRIEKLRRTFRRHRVVTALSAALVLLLMATAVLTGYFSHWSPASSQTELELRPPAEMPARSADGVSGVINGKIYVTSAADGTRGMRKSLYVYDPRANSWRRLADRTVPHGSPAGGVIAGKLYVAGGSDWRDGTDLYYATVEVYDPGSDTWSTKAPMPTARRSCAGAVLNAKLYVVGGWDGAKVLSTVESYDPATDRWTTELSTPSARAGCGAVVIDGTIYVVGGSTNRANDVAATLETWRPGDRWTTAVTGSPMPLPVADAFVTAIDGYLYLAGGANQTGGTDMLQVYIPHWTSTFGIWISRPRMPEVRFQGCGTVVLGSELYVLGGWQEVPSGDGLPHRDVFAYNLRHNSWRRSVSSKTNGE